MPDAKLKQLFDQFDADGTGTVDPMEWLTSLGPELSALVKIKPPGRTPLAPPSAVSDAEQKPISEAALTSEEVKLVAATLKRADRLAALSSELGVKIMIDAEHSFLQPAIDQIVLGLQRKYNAGTGPTVYNTIQCYLKEAPTKLAAHIERSEREPQFHFACKIVRGAYMELERKRAKKRGYPDPIYATLEETHKCYDDAAETILGREAVRTGRSDVNLMVASHNQSSIEKVVDRMEYYGVDRVKGGVAFGQLLGMSDHLSFPLGKAGYLAFKYVPYGPEEEVMPYLVRRAQENSSMLSGAGVECSLIFKELRRRMFA
jgi:proline dehydrogenase